MSDLAVGVRLAVGGGRTSAARLALSALGIAIATAVLLVAASVGTMSDNHGQRAAAELPSEKPVAGVAPTYFSYAATDFRDDRVRISYVWPTAADSPKPKAMASLPRPGEMYASPALVELLRSDAGRLLRPRFPDRVVGVLDKGLVLQPGDLVAWVGADHTLADTESAQPVYGFDQPPPNHDLDPKMLTLLLVGAVVLLLPVFTFVSTASRIAGAERDRRLSALRLVGAGSWQVRRIAAAESLVSAAIGMAAGAAVFAVARQYADDIELFGQRAYTSDVVPNPVLAAIVLLLVPALSVLTALFALRRTIIEPLGVVRQSKPIRRHTWWRFTAVVFGVLLLTTQLGAPRNSNTWVAAVVTGATLLLVGMLALLPWLLERLANHIRGGPPSWVLAVRRLQLDSGTAARVVGGVALVLAGMITMQTLLLTMDGDRGLSAEPETMSGVVEATSASGLAKEIRQDLAGAEGVRSAHTVQTTAAFEEGVRDGNAFGLAVLDCTALKELGGVKTCKDGDVFETDEQGPVPPAGTALEFREFDPGPAAGSHAQPNYEVSGHWTLPSTIQKMSLPKNSALYSSIYVTPGALKTVSLKDLTTVIALVNHNVTSDQLEQIRNAVADYRWRTYVFSYGTAPDLNASQQTYQSIRTGLYAGSVFTLMLAGVSLLVLALEHVRERRRALAVLAATGVPKAVLARSLLWQVALPIVLGVAMALITGIGLAALMVRLTGETLSIDWPGVSLLCAGAIALSLLVSALTLPFLNSATRLTTLRTE
ncbi:ABC transporter permease [Actinophytocola sp.]|uniref:ABC transporter permease n=1 Tax=Actinophytocola sp. TaxID=1872138 RepID=UPI00389ABF3C